MELYLLTIYGPIGPPRSAIFERDNQDQRMYRETLKGLADVEAGRLIGGDQVTAWIASWGSDNELPSPRE